MKTLKDIKFPKHLEGFTESEVVYVYELRQEAINILKQNKEINTADWVEFFNIEQEFADAVLGADE